MALEIRGNQFDYTHENRAFRDVARQLKALFNDQGWNGLLLGNPYCETNPNLQIDFLLYGPEFCIIFDMKDYDGTICIPSEDEFESIPWKVKDKDFSVKGGSHVNPFVQLQNHRNQTLSLLKKEANNSSSTFNDVNFRHLQAAVLFHHSIELDGDIPGSYSRYFFVTDKGNLPEELIDMKSDFSYRLEWADILKSIFKADPYDIEHQLPVVDAETDKKEPREWNPSEQVFQNVYEFIEDDEQKIHIVQGPISSGKISLAHSLKEALLSDGKVTTVEVLSPNKRTATFLNKQYPELTINSLYSTIYGGQSELIEEQVDEELTEDLEVIPIRSQPQNIEGETLYVMLGANLVSNSYNEFTLKRYGSGHLIDDLFKFLNIPHSNNKLLLIGDPYQISSASWEEAALNADFLESKIDTHIGIDDIQPNIDRLDNQHRTRQLLRIPHKIDQDLYNELFFDSSSSLEIIEDKQSVPSKLKDWHTNDKEFVMLTYTNKEAGILNRWFKTKILQKESDLDAGDRLLLQKACKIPADDPFNKPKTLPNGSFVTVDEVGEIESFITKPTGQDKVELKFRHLSVIPEKEQEPVEVYLLENFRKSPKGELTKGEAIAFNKILLNKKIDELKKEQPFEKSNIYESYSDDVKTRSLKESIQELEAKEMLDGEENDELKDLKEQLTAHEKNYKKKYHWALKKKGLDNDPFLNALHAKHGWAMTVHKALGGKWDYILLNADRGENQGIENKNYFKWIYSGLSRATDKAVVVNFESISPFENCSFDSSLPQEAHSPPAAKHNLEGILQDDSFAVREEFNGKYFNDEDFSKIIKRYTRYLAKEFDSNGWNIKDVDTTSNYIIKISVSKDGTEALIVFNYKKDQTVKKPARIENIKNGSKKEVQEKISFVPSGPNEGAKNLNIPSDFRRSYYKQWIEVLGDEGFKVTKIKPLSYQDRFTLQKSENWLSFNVIYNSNGFFSKIEAFRASKPEMWDSVLTIIKRKDYE
jgi:hypothetical protein